MSQRVATAHFERANQLSAAGDFDEAINELARGTRAGDLHCTRELGLRLLSGDRAPLMPAEGLSFLDDALEQGMGEVGARAAGRLTLGANFPPDWKLALDWLRRSAEAGWERSQVQLLGLCDDRALAARMASAPRIDWKAVAAAVELDSWKRCPPAKVLSDDPRLSSFIGFVRPELCRFILSLTEGRLEPAKVYDPVNLKDIVMPHRNNTLATFDFYSIEMVQALIQSRMAAACGIPERHMEAPSVLHYAPGEEIRDHYDFVDPKSTPDYAAEIARNGQRIITFLVYLNDDYDGGETNFPRLDVCHKGECGEGFYFTNALADLSPDMRVLHAGCPTTRGEKFIITQFIRNRPTR